MADNVALVDRIAQLQDLNAYQDLHWDGSFEDYLQLVERNPKVTRTAFQRVYDMILSYGREVYEDNKKTVVHYPFFDDPFEGGRDAIFGLDIPLMRLVALFRAAAEGYGVNKRIILLHRPVGCAKSTLVRLIKKGLEHYSRTDAGAAYTFSWHIPGADGEVEVCPCPMNEDPLHLVPPAWRGKVFGELVDPTEHRIAVEGDLCPHCRWYFRDLMETHGGDWRKVIDHVSVHRLVFSEQDRIGIGTFQPKDEKNQDSTELTGDLNYRKIAEYGSDSDPRAFNFDGELNIANRGIIEFVEMLKLDVAFLYDLLGASQEHKIKPKKFAQTDIDEVIIGHTNEPEYRKLQNNEFMEALRDRTLKVDVPYITRLSQELRIYAKDFNETTVPSKHIAPHTLEVAAMWAVLTRLEEPKKHNLTLLQKLKLYDGRSIPGYTQDNVKELRKETSREGMEGISPRYVQDKVSNALVNERAAACVNPFLVLSELEKGLRTHSLIANDKQRVAFRELIGVVRDEYAEMVKNEVQRAISADDQAIAKLFANYIDNVKAYTQKERVKNKFTGQYEEPDERLMRAIEEKIGIPDSRKDDFRTEVMNHIGALAVEGKPFDHRADERLLRALELKLFEDQKDTIKLTSLVSSVMDKETQEKIDILKSRLIKHHGYCPICAADVLSFVASIFARGDVKGRKG